MEGYGPGADLVPLRWHMPTIGCTINNFILLVPGTLVPLLMICNSSNATNLLNLILS